MWSKINTLRRFLRVSITKTLFINFYMLPFAQAIKLPIILTRNVKFYSLSGKIIIKDPIRFGMIRFGFFGEDNMYWNCNKTFLKIDGVLELFNNVHFANGILLRIEKEGHLTIEENTRISNNVKLICYKAIHIKKNTRIAWECQLIDTTFHFIKDIKSNVFNELNGKIIVGENNWIGNRCSIMKGSILPNYCIVSSYSLVNKSFTDSEYIVLGGIPAKIIKNGVYRVLDAEEKLIKESIK